MLLVDLDVDVIRYTLHFLELWDIQNISKTCTECRSICNMPNIIHTVSFYQDALCSDHPLTHHIFNSVSRLIYDDDIDSIQCSKIKPYWTDKVKVRRDPSSMELLPSWYSSRPLDEAEITSLCIDEIQNWSIHKIRQKLWNQNWMNSLNRLEIRCQANRNEKQLDELLPPRFIRLESLKMINLRNPSNVIRRAMTTLVTLEVTLWYSSNYTDLVDAILNCQRLQYLTVTGWSRTESTEHQSEHSVFSDILQSEHRTLSRLKTLKLFRMDNVNEIYLLWTYLLEHATSCDMIVHLEPTAFSQIKSQDASPTFSVGDILLSPKVDLRKISVLRVHLLDTQCWDTLQRFVSKCNVQRDCALDFLGFKCCCNTVTKDGFLNVLPVALCDMLIQSISIQIESVIHCGEIMTLKEIEMFWKRFVEEMNHRILSSDLQSRKSDATDLTVKRLVIRFEWNMWNCNMKSVDLIRGTGTVLELAIERKLLMRFRDRGICELLSVELDMNSYREGDEKLFDAVVDEMNHNLKGVLVRRGKHGGHFVYVFE